MTAAAVGGAGDSAGTARGRPSLLVVIDGKIGAAATVHPDASAVKSPAVALVTGRVAALLQQAYSPARVRWTIVPAPVVRRTRNSLGRASWAENNKGSDHEAKQDPIPCTKHFPTSSTVMGKQSCSLSSSADFETTALR